MLEKKILIIDDEERIREIVQVCLQDLGGWDVVTADSGREGLVKAKTESPNAILLDVSMPDIDGFEFFDRLQQTPGLKEIPVILLTAKVLPQDRHNFERMGVKGLIAKPFNPLTLAEEVGKLLDADG